MRKWLLCLLAGLVSAWAVQAQEYPELGAKLEEYFTALAGDSASAQIKECDFLIESCRDSLVRQYVALKIYDHYLNSKIMGDDAVAVHVADKWFLSGAIPMHTELDLMNARIFADFNRHSLIGNAAPVLKLKGSGGRLVKVPASGAYSVLYFYDTGCSTCKVESARLSELALSGEYPINVYAIYVGDDAEAWQHSQASFLGVHHLWDPARESDWQLQYGVLKTPWMLLVSPSGTILGRGLDTPTLKMLLGREFSSSNYEYGADTQMDRYSQMFAAYGDTLSVEHIMNVADYMAARTIGEGDQNAFKQVEGDLLYYLAQQRGEVYKDAIVPLVERYILMPDLWNTEEDRAQVVSLGNFLTEMTSRTPVGTQVPDLEVPGTLRRHRCLFVKDPREGVFKLRALKGRPGYVVFYSAGCSLCQETLSAVEKIVSENVSARVLLIDMDSLMSEQPEKARELLDTFDLTAMPFVLELDRKGVIKHRYVQL
ncbi:MAG: hypothetical protein J5669_04720 [Bacteroidales bacterium]|nr:hypothetical protein [Bacteroidales bacterium]